MIKGLPPVARLGVDQNETAFSAFDSNAIPKAFSVLEPYGVDLRPDDLVLKTLPQSVGSTIILSRSLALGLARMEDARCKSQGDDPGECSLKGHERRSWRECHEMGVTGTINPRFFRTSPKMFSRAGWRSAGLNLDVRIRGLVSPLGDKL